MGLKQALLAMSLVALSLVTAATAHASGPDQQHDDQQNGAANKPSQPPTTDPASELKMLQSELAAQTGSFNKRPRKTFISASTQQPGYAAYLRDWTARVEHVGNLNYPEEARQQHLHGAPTLMVGLNRDGSIYRIDVIHSSGSSLLDTAAQRIVRLAAPFAPLPAESNPPDVLYLTRTWEFAPGNAPHDH